MSNLQIGQMGSRPSPMRLLNVSLTGAVPAAAGAVPAAAVARAFVSLTGWPLGASNNEHILNTLKRRSGERRQGPPGMEDGEGRGIACADGGGIHSGQAEWKMGTIGRKAVGAESGAPSIKTSEDGVSPLISAPPGGGGEPAFPLPLLPSPPAALLLVGNGGTCRTKLRSGGAPLPRPPSRSL